MLSDGADCAYLCDVAVMPDHQGTGLGRAVVQRLLDHCKGHRKIILDKRMTNLGTSGFFGKDGAIYWTQNFVGR